MACAKSPSRSHPFNDVSVSDIFSAPNLFQSSVQSGRNYLQSSHRARRICAFCAFWLFAVFWIVVSLISGNCISRRYQLVTLSQNICLHKSCSQKTWYNAFKERFCGRVLHSCGWGFRCCQFGCVWGLSWINAGAGSSQIECQGPWRDSTNWDLFGGISVVDQFRAKAV